MPKTPYKEGTVVHSTVRITEEDMTRFGDLSGDHNPLHEKDSFAQQHGFPGKVVYGGLLVASLSKLIGMKIPGTGSIWHKADLEFKNPLYVEETAELEAKVVYCNAELHVLQLQVTLLCGKRLILKGKLQAGWRE